MALLYPLIPLLAGTGILWWAMRESGALTMASARLRRANAEVVGYAETGRSSRMIIQFRTGEGVDIQTVHSSTAWSAARRGEQVVVAYDHDDPERAHIVEGPWLSQWTPRLLSATGLVLLLVGGVLAVLAWT